MFINKVSKKQLLSSKPNNPKTIRQSYQNLAEEILKQNQISQDLKTKNEILNKCNDIDTVIAGLLDSNPRRSAVPLVTLVENGYAFKSAAQIAKHLIQSADDSQAEFDIDIEHGKAFNQRNCALAIFDTLFKQGQAFEIATNTAERLTDHEKWTKRRSGIHLFKSLVNHKQAIKPATDSAEKGVLDSHYRIRTQAAYLFTDLVRNGHSYDKATRATITLSKDEDNGVKLATMKLLKALLNNNYAVEETKNVLAGGYLNSYYAKELLDHFNLINKKNWYVCKRSSKPLYSC